MVRPALCNHCGRVELIQLGGYSRFPEATVSGWKNGNADAIVPLRLSHKPHWVRISQFLEASLDANWPATASISITTANKTKNILRQKWSSISITHNDSCQLCDSSYSIQSEKGQKIARPSATAVQISPTRMCTQYKECINMFTLTLKLENTCVYKWFFSAHDIL